MNLVTYKNVGLIGAGQAGSALAKILVKAGHSVKVANSRGPRTLREFELETKSRAVDISEVTEDISILMIAIPFFRIADLRGALKGMSRNTIVVDTGNYNPLRDGSIAAIDQGMPESAWVSEQIGLPVVKAFNNIISLGLAIHGKPKGDCGRIALPVAADDPEAGYLIRQLIEETGFDAFDAGTISESWRQQPGQPAYCTEPTLKELPVLLQQADQVNAIANRGKVIKLMNKIPPEFPAQGQVRASRLSVGLDAWIPKSWLAMLRLAMAFLRAL